MSSGGCFDVQAPLFRWSVFHSYDTARECEAASLAEMAPVANRSRGVVERKEPMTQQEWEDTVAWKRMGLSQCIASDDPRLKGK